MGDKQLEQIALSAVERTEETILEFSRELSLMTPYPMKRLRILAWVHAIAEQAVKAAVSEFTVTEQC